MGIQPGFLFFIWAVSELLYSSKEKKKEEADTAGYN